MEKNQPSRGALAGVPSTHNRQLLLARVFLLALLIALSVMSVQPRSSAQSADRLLRTKGSVASRRSTAAALDCGQQCQQQLVQCLASGRDAAACDAKYDACLAGCP